ncbi:MAG: BatA domain-containing protein [Gemmatimonadota bacterium]|nr:BatA domain-containing protein [Gemmatimonadota bacterium]
MSFLVPLFLLGMVGLAIPLAIHLTRRQRRNVVAFPSLMFLAKIPYQEQRRRRIQHWFLLLLRAVALALIVFAFARPFFDRSDLIAGTASGPREVVVLLDRSYSMDVEGRMDGARSEAERIFEQLGPLDRASLVTFDRSAAVLVRSTSDRGRLRAALDTVRSGSDVTRFSPALKVAQTILEESELPASTVHLLSDFQRTGWSDDESVRLPAGSEFVPVPVGGEAPENVQVAGVSLPRTVDAGRERITPTARVVRRGGEGPTEVPVTLKIDGQPVETVEVELGGEGAASVTFQPVTLSRPHTRGTVSTPEDAVPADDRRHFVVSPGTVLTVRVVGSTSGESDPNLYLARALGISQDGRFEVTTRRRNGLVPADTEGVDVLVLNDVRVDGAAAERLRSFVENGGGLLVALGENATWPASAADLLPGDPGSPRDREAGRGARLGQLAYDHPVFEPFAGPRGGGFGNARFFRARDLTPTDSAEVLARFDDGSVALAEATRGDGRVLVWTTTLDAYWNDLALQPVYLPFVHRMAEHLAGRTEATPWFTVGQIVDLSDPEMLEAAGLDASAAELEAGGERVALDPSGAGIRLSEGTESQYLTLAEHGFYIIRPPGADPERPFTLAVNVDLEESAMSRIDPEEVALRVEAATVASEDGGTTEAAAQTLRMEDQERRQSLWRWILAGALGLLILETLISNWVSRTKAVASPQTGTIG